MLENLKSKPVRSDGRKMEVLMLRRSQSKRAKGSRLRKEIADSFQASFGLWQPIWKQLPSMVR